MRTGFATFGLDTGRCPPWLFERMRRLSGIIAEAIVVEFGPAEFLRRLADPVWFQSFGSVLAFDWNSSGLTVTTMGALKEALRNRWELGVWVTGGKGKTSLKTPDELTTLSERIGLGDEAGTRMVRLSRLVAKVDNNLVQDGFQLYHHNFLFTREGDWTVVQQGMHKERAKARRYHWNNSIWNDKINLFDDPHRGIASQLTLPRVMNLATGKSAETRATDLYLVQNTETFLGEIRKMQNVKIKDQNVTHLTLFSNDRAEDFRTHPLLLERFDAKRLEKSVRIAADFSPRTFLNLVETRGVGPRTIRALSLVAELIYGAKPSYEDPARYSFAHGGKDAIPFPVDRIAYDKTIAVMERALQTARIAPSEKDDVLRRLEKARNRV